MIGEKETWIIGSYHISHRLMITAMKVGSAMDLDLELVKKKMLMANISECERSHTVV